MTQKKVAESKGTCFVVMGFGKKTDFESGKVLDLNKSYTNMIKPAVEATGYKCIRADEIVHSGIIDVPMYDQLLKADIVVADLSTSNKNAYYELGVRHALRPYTTVIISDDSIKNFPFDISHIVVRQYHHLGEDIGFDEVMRFRKLLTKAIKELRDKDPLDNDSPVYTFLNGLTPPILKEVQEQVQQVIELHSNGAGADDTLFDINLKNESETHSILMRQADEAQAKGDWITVKTIFTLVRKMANDEIKKKQVLWRVNTVKPQEDTYILQRLALATYKSESPDKKTALANAQQLLILLNPITSNDTETLGLWGAVHKRLWELEKTLNYLDEAIRAYERGFYIKNDYYNGINYAFLLNERASQSVDRAEAIADFVEARRIRKEVISICEQWLKNNPIPDKEKAPENIFTDYLKSWYWVKASLAEAYVGLDKEDEAQLVLTEAYDKAPEGWMKGTTEDQLKKLRLLLDDSPLKYVRTEG